MGAIKSLNFSNMQMPELEERILSKPRDECAVMAVKMKDPNNMNAALFTIIGLTMMYNRGDQSSGITVYNPEIDEILKSYKGLGPPHEVFKLSHFQQFEQIRQLYQGSIAIGHNRYTTAGLGADDPQRALLESQPMIRDHGRRSKHFAIAFNGNMQNYKDRRRILQESGYHLKTTVDTEVKVHTLAHHLKELHIESDHIPDLVELIRRSQAEWIGANAMVYLDALGRLCAHCDPIGYKPLVYGENDDLIAIASQSSALEMIGIPRNNIKDVRNGEIITINGSEINRHQYVDEIQERKFCTVEFSYHSDPDDIIDGTPVDLVRTNEGRELALNDPYLSKLIIKHGRENIIVCGLPNSGIPAGQGYAKEAGLEYIQALKGKIPWRTFIQKLGTLELLQSIKYFVRSDLIDGKVLIVIDDTLIKGHTMKKNMQEIYAKSNPKEVHIRIAHPELKYPCYDGTDIPSCNVLTASQFEPSMLEQELVKMFNIKTIYYNTVESLERAIGRDKKNLCMACTTGGYPTVHARQRFERENPEYQHLMVRQLDKEP